MTLPVATTGGGWLLAAAAVCFGMLAIGAAVDALRWDGPITRAVIDTRTPFWNSVALRVSSFGSHRRRRNECDRRPRRVAPLPSLGVAIVVLAVARPLSEFVLKELIGRDRPSGDRMVRGRGPAFPSGHPYAVAMAWGLIPMVSRCTAAARACRGSSPCGLGAAVAVAASRVWLGVHWTSDAAARILVGLLAVCLAERAVAANGCASAALPSNA